MSYEFPLPVDFPAEETIDSTRLHDPGVIERRAQFVSALVAIFRGLERFLGEPIGDVWDHVRRLEPEAAADIARIDARLDRVAVRFIDGRTTIDELERTLGTYLLFWRRAVAALQLRELTCSRCLRMTATVAVRGEGAERFCRRCWKAATG